MHEPAVAPGTRPASRVERMPQNQRLRPIRPRGNDVERCVGYARRVNPRIEPLRLSAATGEGCDQWLAWLRSELDAARGSAVEARQTAAST